MAEKKDEELIEQLICQVSTHDAIFNKRNKDHMRTQCVEGAWSEISSALNKDVQWCIEKWKNLQRNYRNFLNKENLPSGSGANSRGRPKFAFAQQMSFLLEHIQPKVTKSNFKRKEQSPESFHGQSSDDLYAGGTQSSKSFRGLTQSQIDDLDDSTVNYAVFMRDTLNLSPREVTQQEPHCSRNPPKRSSPRKRVHSSSEEDVESQKTTTGDIRIQNLPAQNLSPHEVTQEPHCSRNPPKRSAPRKKVHSSSEDDVASQKTTTGDIRKQNLPEHIDHVAGDSGNEDNESNQIPIIKQGQGRNKKTKKNPKRQPRKRDVESSPERQEMEEGFYLRMTEAARSITNRFQPKEKEKPSDQDAIINHFCKMQKHMLRTINEDARREYMKQCTNKLFELCELEQYVE